MLRRWLCEKKTSHYTKSDKLSRDVFKTLMTLAHSQWFDSNIRNVSHLYRFFTRYSNFSTIQIAPHKQQMTHSHVILVLPARDARLVLEHRSCVARSFLQLNNIAITCTILRHSNHSTFTCSTILLAWSTSISLPDSNNCLTDRVHNGNFYIGQLCIYKAFLYCCPQRTSRI